MKSLIFKISVIAVIMVAGWIAVFSIPDAVESFLPTVETITITPTQYSETVSGTGVITQTAGGWFVTVSVSEADIRRVQIGQPAALSGAAFDDGIYTATVHSIAEYAALQQSQFISEIAIEVTLRIDNPEAVVISGTSGTSGESGGILRSGYSARADIQTEQTRTIFTIPYSSILQDDSGEFVYVLSQNSAIRRNILTGIELSDGAEIISGLRVSDQIIANPQSLAENALVNPLTEVSR
jgi:multidrug efflux pump subunit AcrA (membrane-fusion protein)